jgi:diguanylate cyclase
MDLETSEETRKVALAVVKLAKALDLKVVAEGVETEAQNRILRDFGCDSCRAVCSPSRCRRRRSRCGR